MTDNKENSLEEILELHQKEIWEWKQKESKWIKTDNQLAGCKKIIIELSAKIVQLKKELLLQAKLKRKEAIILAFVIILQAVTVIRYFIDYYFKCYFLIDLFTLILIETIFTDFVFRIISMSKAILY